MKEYNARYNSYRIDSPSEFNDVFSHFYFAKNESSETIKKTLLPSFQTILVFSFGGSITLTTKQQLTVKVDKCLVLGPIKQAFDYSLDSSAEMFVINFKDDAFYRLFKFSSDSANLPMHPDQLLNDNCFSAMWATLKAMDNQTSRMDYVLSFCKSYLGQRETLASQLSLIKEKSVDPIKVGAELSQKSERTIQIKHKQYFGYSAKEFNRYQRFLNALEKIHDAGVNDQTMVWQDIIYACGYYDQSHFNHDFKHYLNLSPSQYMLFQQDICNPVS